MSETGKKISILRKEKNMTQMELADKLGISFQAVSNWERGQTMPDISKLGELAGIFGVTIDELLGNNASAQVVKRLVKEEPVPERLTTEEFLDVAPLVKPRQAEKLWEKVSADVSLRDLAKAAPFLNADLLDSLAIEAMEREKSFDALAPLLPFLSEQALDQCADLALSDGLDLKKIMAAAPFLSQECLGRLADRTVQEAGIQELVPLAPFLDEERLTRYAVQALEKGGFSQLIPLFPFLNGDLLGELLRGKHKEEGGR